MLPCFSYVFSGEVNDGYFKDDNIMTEKELENENVLPYFSSYKYTDFSTILEEKNLTESENIIFYYLHGMQDELKEHHSPESFDVLPKDIDVALDKYKYGTGTHQFFLSILEDKEFLLKNNLSLNLSNISKHIGMRYDKKMNDILNILLAEESFEIKENNLHDFCINYNFDVSVDNVESYLKLKNKNLNQELFEYLNADIHNSLSIDLRNILKKIGDNNLGSMLLNIENKDRAAVLLNNTWRDKEIVYNMDKDIYKIVDIVNDSNFKFSNSFLDLIITEAKKYNLDINKIEENKEEQTIEYIKNYPKKLFIKNKTIQDYNIKFNKEDSLNILKKAFFEKVQDFNQYSDLDVVEDIEYGFNERSINLLFSGSLLDSNAKKEFIQFLDNIDKEEKTSKYNDKLDNIKKLTNNKTLFNNKIKL